MGKCPECHSETTIRNKLESCTKCLWNCDLIDNRDNDIKIIPVELFAPVEFWQLTPEQRNSITNGCGPGGWRIDLIPDELSELPIHTCCDIHDYMYNQGKTIEDKNIADRTFLNNMLRMIEASPNKSYFTETRRKLAAHLYYEAVHKFGGPAFWKNKNKPEELNIVELTFVV